MIGNTRAVRVYAWPAPTDLRKGFNGLYGMVTQQMKLDPLSGAYFLFINRRRTTSKVLLWDGTGLCIYQKRLERGRFAKLWGHAPHEPLKLTPSELALFLEGAELSGRLPLSPPEFALSKETG